MWYRETGIVGRLLRTYQPQKPECLSSATVHATSFNGVITAFMVLGCEFGMEEIRSCTKYSQSFQWEFSSL